MKTIVSFGDSFIFGSELENNLDGSRAWPGLIAKRLEINYKTCAYPGCGNESISRQIYEYFSENSKEDTVAVINWTWMMRWDFYMTSTDTWITLGPTCEPGKLYDHLSRSEATYLIEFYKNYPEMADSWNRYRSLQSIYAAQQFLKANQIPTIQTYMDTDLFSKGNNGDRLEHYNAFKDSSWPEVITIQDLDNLPSRIKEEIDQDYNKVKVPSFIGTLQDLIFDELLTFEGQTFLEWSRGRGYPVTPTPFDHPLAAAHEAAADLCYDQYYQTVNSL